MILIVMITIIMNPDKFGTALLYACRHRRQNTSDSLTTGLILMPTVLRRGIQ